jgi:hypothetical protein
MTATKRYFALFGPRASGKTVYLGALYGSSGDPAEGGPAYHVAASEDANDPTHAYLGRVSRALKSGKWPDATGCAAGRPIGFICRDLLDISLKSTRFGPTKRMARRFSQAFLS